MRIRRNIISNIYVLLILIGSQVVGVFGSILKVNTQLLLWLQYGITAGIAVHLILNGVTKGRKNFDLGWAFIIFFFMYLFRMYIDLYVHSVYTSTFSSPHTYFIYILGICFLFSYALCYAQNLDFDFISKWFYILLYMVVILSIFYNSVLGLDESSTMRNAGAENIGSLTYGHLGVSFFLISLHYFLDNRKIANKIFFIVSMAVGLLVMYLASSRSPLLALVLCTVIYLLIYRGAFMGIIVFLTLLLPIYLYWDAILSLLSVFHGDFILRIMMAIEDGDSSGRDVIYAQGISQFVEYPIFGGSFLLEAGEFKGLYPHNLFLECLMATGIIGFVFFIIWLLRVLKASFYLIKVKNRYAWIPTLFLQYLIFNMTSKSLYTNNYLWYFSFLVLYLIYTIKKENRYE